MLYALQSVNTIASRMLFTLSRDRGVAGLSPYLAPVHPTLKVPVWSLVAVFVCSIVLGTICESEALGLPLTPDLGSTVAFNAIAGSSMFFLNFSYIVPRESESLCSTDVQSSSSSFAARKFSMGSPGAGHSVAGDVSGWLGRRPS